MISDKDWKELLEEVNFEFSLEDLKKMISYDKAMELYKWLKKYKMNILKVNGLRYKYSDELLSGNQLSKDDPRYDELDGWMGRYAKPDAPENIKRVSDAYIEFEPLAKCFPHMEFFENDLLAVED